MQIGGTGVVVVGRVETGSLRTGAELLLMPGNVTAQVLSIEMHHEKLEKAVCGDHVDINIDISSMKDIRRGMVASLVDDSPARECSSFLAQVIVLSMPRAGEIRAGCILYVECHTAQVPCEFEELLSRTDRRTGKVLEMQPASLLAGDAAVVRLRPQEPMCVEAFGEYPPLGRFAVRDQKTTVAVGVVQQVVGMPATAFPGPSAKPVGSRQKLSKTATVLGTGTTKSKPKVPTGGRVCSSGTKQQEQEVNVSDADDLLDADLLDASPKMAPAPSPFANCGAGSPFAAFGAVTRVRAKWRAHPDSGDHDS